MAKAVLIILEKSGNTKELVQDLQDSGLLNQNLTLHNTYENDQISQILSSYGIVLKNPSGVHSPPSLRPREDMIIDIIHQTTQQVFIESSKVVLNILRKLLGNHEFDLESDAKGYSLFLNDGTWSLRIIKPPTDSEEDISIDESTDIESNILRVAKQETLNYLGGYIKSRTSDYEQFITNTHECCSSAGIISRKLLGVRKMGAEESKETRIDAGNRRERYSELTSRIGEARNSLEVCNGRIFEVMEAIKPRGIEMGFENISLPLNEYRDDMLDLKESQSFDNGNHIFTVTNRTAFKLSNLKIYQSDSQEPFISFEMAANEEKILSEDYLIETLKYNGFITFQVYFCTFPVSKRIETQSVSIVSVVQKENGKLDISFHSHVLACDGIQIMINDSPALINFKIKNFQKSSVEVNIEGRKGPAVLIMHAKNKRVSNQFQLTLE